jgi:hypothetical protein
MRRVRPPETLSADKIDTGYRLFWTRMVLAWDAPRRALIAARVAAVIDAPDFEPNALERRFRIEDLDDQAHSGASLQALRDVLRAVEAEEGDES